MNTKLSEVAPMEQQIITWWAGAACGAVTRALFPPRRRYHRGVLIGGSLFWLAVGSVLWAYYLLKFTLWLVLCTVIVHVNVLQILVLAPLQLAVRWLRVLWDDAAYAHRKRVAR